MAKKRGSWKSPKDECQSRPKEIKLEQTIQENTEYIAQQRRLNPEMSFKDMMNNIQIVGQQTSSEVIPARVNMFLSNTGFGYYTNNQASSNSAMQQVPAISYDLVNGKALVRNQELNNKTNEDRHTALVSPKERADDFGGALPKQLDDESNKLVQDYYSDDEQLAAEAMEELRNLSTNVENLLDCTEKEVGRDSASDRLFITDSVGRVSTAEFSDDNIERMEEEDIFTESMMNNWAQRMTSKEPGNEKDTKETEQVRNVEEPCEDVDQNINAAEFIDENVSEIDAALTSADLDQNDVPSAAIGGLEACQDSPRVQENPEELEKDEAVVQNYENVGQSGAETLGNGEIPTQQPQGFPRPDTIRNEPQLQFFNYLNFPPVGALWDRHLKDQLLRPLVVKQQEILDAYPIFEQYFASVFYFQPFDENAYDFWAQFYLFTTMAHRLENFPIVLFPPERVRVALNRSENSPFRIHQLPPNAQMFPLPRNSENIASLLNFTILCSLSNDTGIEDGLFHLAIRRAMNPVVVNDAQMHHMVNKLREFTQRCPYLQLLNGERLQTVHRVADRIFFSVWFEMVLLAFKLNLNRVVKYHAYPFFAI